MGDDLSGTGHQTAMAYSTDHNPSGICAILAYVFLVTLPIALDIKTSVVLLSRPAVARLAIISRVFVVVWETLGTGLVFSARREGRAKTLFS